MKIFERKSRLLPESFCNANRIFRLHCYTDDSLVKKQAHFFFALHYQPISGLICFRWFRLLHLNCDFPYQKREWKMNKRQMGKGKVRNKRNFKFLKNKNQKNSTSTHSFFMFHIEILSTYRTSPHPWFPKSHYLVSKRHCFIVWEANLFSFSFSFFLSISKLSAVHSMGVGESNYTTVLFLAFLTITTSCGNSYHLSVKTLSTSLANYWTTLIIFE